MSAGRILVVDATFDHRVALQLSDRGRNAVPVKDHNLQGAKDEVLLSSLATIYAGRDWMLLTSDDNMPAEHAGVIAALAPLTIATVDGRVYGMNQEAYKHEVVHRWVHVMQDQDTGTIRRYGLESHALWTPRRTRPRRHPR